MPINRADDPEEFQAAPPTLAAPPPMKLPVMLLLSLDKLLIRIALAVELAVGTRDAVWKKLLPLMVHSVFPPSTSRPWELAAALKKLEILLFEIVLPLLKSAAV